MFGHSTRRRFLQGSLAAGLADSGLVRSLTPVSAAEARPDPAAVRFSAEIEPLVRLLEETPRAELLEVVGRRIRAGLAYRDLLTALLLAGIRNIEPRPQVGFKFHGVLVINSAHLASLASPAEHRWLPIFWALDHFKQSQGEQISQHPWKMSPPDEAKLPRPSQAHQALADALENWDEPAADTAATALARSAGEQEIFELLFRYGARDFRSIGHKAIYVANSRRLLDTIGWQHGEAVVRSLAYALLMHEGDNPAKGDAEADRAGRVNLSRVGTIRADWLAGRTDAAATTDLLSVLREATPEAASAKVIEMLNAGIGPQSIWDALFVGAGELLLRQRGIVSLHAVTTTNALRFAFETSGNDETRRLLLLQNAAFLPHFRQAMQDRGKIGAAQIDKLEAAPLAEPSEKAVAEILVDIGKDRGLAARKTLTFARQHEDPRGLIDAARLQVFFKGKDPHDYKFSSAVFEDYAAVSPAWRDRYLAASTSMLLGSGGAENALVQRTRDALKGA